MPAPNPRVAAFRERPVTARPGTDTMGLVALLVVSLGCAGGGAGCEGDLDTWLYWLSDPDPGAIAAADGTAVVVDYSAGGGDGSAFSADDVRAMAGDGGREVLAYLSIGEAEDYRYYWDPAWDDDGDGEPDAGAPGWLGPSNPDWEGNYKVRYWDPAWQELLLGDDGYMGRILAAGFDGVYLDIVDAYYYWAVEAPALERRPVEETAAEMIALLDAIGDSGHARDAEFLVFPQNGEFVGCDAGDDGMDRLLQVIDGFGVEDVFFQGDDEMDNPLDPDFDRLDVLGEVVLEGKRVLSVEYLTDDDAIDAYLTRTKRQGFAACVADRDLGSLPRTP